MGSKTTFKASEAEAAKTRQLQLEAASRRLRRKLAQAPLEDHEGYRMFLRNCIGDLAAGREMVIAA